MYNPFNTKNENEAFAAAIANYENEPEAVYKAGQKLIVKKMVRAAVIGAAVVTVAVIASALIPDDYEETTEEENETSN